MGKIYMNGKRTTLENIFDAVNPGRPDLWRYVSESDVMRPIKTILDEWVKEHSTYFYIRGTLTTFELR